MSQRNLRLSGYLHLEVAKDVPTSTCAAAVALNDEFRQAGIRYDHARVLLRKLRILSYWKIDMCDNSCTLFYGPLANTIACPECEAPRFNSEGRAMRKFTYIPLSRCRVLQTGKDEDGGATIICMQLYHKSRRTAQGRNGYRCHRRHFRRSVLRCASLESHT